MQKQFIRWGLVLGLSCLGVSCLDSTVLAASAPAGVGQSDNGRALNLARLDFGTRLTVQTPGTQSTNANAVASAALLTEGYSLGYVLAEGSTQMIVTLPKAEILHRFNFMNQNAAGQVSISVSSVSLPADSPRWRQVTAAQDFSAPGEVVSCDLGTVEARYVKVVFNIHGQGRIDTFGLFGRLTVASSGHVAADSRFIGYDAVENGAPAAPSTVVMVSNGEDLTAAQAITAEDYRKSYTFKAGDDRPMVVLDLGRNRPVSRISLGCNAAPGTLSFYVVGDPNANEGLFHTAHTGAPVNVQDFFGSNFPGDRQPSAIVPAGEKPGLERLTADTQGTVGRFVAIIYTPSGGVAPAPVEGKDFKDFKGTTAGTQLPPGAPLELSSVKVYGPPPAPPNNIFNPPGYVPPSVHPPIGNTTP